MGTTLYTYLTFDEENENKEPSSSQFPAKEMSLILDATRTVGRTCNHGYIRYVTP
jgi:hypothetical protein